VTFDQLYQYFLSEGYQAHIAPPSLQNWMGFGDLELERDADGFRVAEFERGQICATLLQTKDEAEACDYFRRLIGAQNLHLVSRNDETSILLDEVKLEAAQVEFNRNDIWGFSGPGTTRYRIFVRGTVLKRARMVLGLIGDGMPSSST
jgi:hypothetical protein